MNKVYVLCPSYLVSGGPDALHQMVYYLNSLGIEAYIVYVDIKTRKYAIPQEYRVYTDNYKLLADVEDNENTAIVCPETLIFLLNKFNYTKKYIWWLSVDNNVKRSGFFDKLKLLLNKVSPKKLFAILKKKNKFCNLKYFIKHNKYNFSKEDVNVKHLCASYYAYDYVSVRTKNPLEICIEPLSKYFLENSSCSLNARSDKILYNPAKNLKFTKKIIRYCNDFEFVPLKGLKQNELLDLYKKSKLYIDFGFFPGAERIPKEAVLNGCAIITGKMGASAYYKDVPIPDQYKIDAYEENLPAIKNAIDKALREYDSRFNDFNLYKETVNQLEKNFIKKLSEIFGK